MKHVAYAAAFSALALLTGCASQNVSQPAVPLNGTVKTNLQADVKVGEPISGQSSVNILFGVFKLGGDTQFADGVTYGGGEGGFALGLDPVASAKSAAAYKAVKASGADVIVAPRYEVNVEDYFVYKTVNVSVTGHKGTVTAIR
ncbi:hypothetical protein EA796_11950 [Pseudomonas sp. AOB-7]|jgi:hypothetical protein|uniref:hypothetical protein n=1 Tax=unclassified Pseudomonas TaxID=196821 RepID=UPI000396C642|nr:MULTISPECIES: hypothetical protein [unclassified Pseudomonas]ERI50846.1 hypothetical protein N878_07715 [Pseudomonas sp. EGD-AK9]RMH84401.1 hypothetical protein EA796_11950 [Pseudomonas sp. AOB-7]